MIRRETTHPFSVVSNPEFLKQGAAIDDFMKPDRVVIGAEDPRSAELMKELYSPFTRTGAPIMMMDCASAELCKYAANAMLATRISFMNEVSNVCEAVGANVDQVRRAVASDRRIGPRSCSPASATAGAASRRTSRRWCASPRTRTTNSRSCTRSKRSTNRQKTRLITKMEKHFGSLKGKRIAVWGLAFKPKTDDMREAPAVPLIQGLLAAGASVHAYDPEAMKVARGIFGSKVHFAENNYAALTGADALAIVTEWNEFREPDYARMRKLMRTPVIFDGRNIYNPESLRGRKASLTSRWGVPSRGSRGWIYGTGDRRGWLYRQSRGQSAAGARRERRRLRQSQPGAPRRRSAATPSSSKGTSTTPPA